FNPPPKVDSAIVRLTPHAELPHPADDVEMLEIVVREAFNQRRKTLRNTLKPLLDADAIAEEGLDPTLRPEQVDLAGFVRLANRLSREGAPAMTDALAKSISIQVQVRYLTEQSKPADNRFAFAYTITICNEGDRAAQLLDRHWIITDGNGKIQE